MDWFRDFDPLSSGKITRAQFRRCLELIQIKVTDDEFTALADEFSVGDRVNYKEFLDAVHDIHTNKDLEKDPLATVNDPHQVITRTLDTDTSLDPALDRILTKIAHEVKTKGIYIREAFEDFDKHNTGNVTKSQFERALPFRQLTQAEVALLVKRYQDPQLKDVNYKKMIVDVNNIISRGIESYATTSTFLPHQLKSIKVKNFDNPHDDLLMKFATYVTELRIRIYDFFEAHDQLRKGVITKPKFEATLANFGFPFSSNDIAYVSSLYAEQIASVNYVRYVEFCKDIESMSESQTKTRSIQTTEAPMEAEGILKKVRDTISRFRINVMPTMQDFDRNNRGYITPSQFHRALATLKISITTEDLEVIARLYNRNDGIDYYRFIEDVEPTHTQRRREYRPVRTTKQSIVDTFGKTPTGDRFVTPEEADGLIYQSKTGLMKKPNAQHDMYSLLQELKRWSYVNSVHFHDYMSDFDRHKWGEITANQLRSAMTMSQYPITDEEFQLIQENYASDTRPGYVKWKEFADDIVEIIAPHDLEVEPLKEPEHPRTATQAIKTRSIPSQGSKQINQTLDNIARFVKTRRVALYEQFKDKDKHNHKRITATGFAQVIQLIGIHITKAEIDELCSFYNDPLNNFVDYTRFVDDIDRLTGQIFGDRAQNSIVINPIPQYSREESPYLVSRRSTASHIESWEEILARLQTFVYKRRIRLGEFFQQFDELRRGKVTQQKFHSVVGEVNLPLTADQIDTVLREFEVDGDFDYRSFCREVNKIFGPTELNRSPIEQETFKTRALPDPSETLQKLDSSLETELNQILSRMRQTVVTRRMNIREQFADYDRSPHKNYITKQQFKQSIARLGLTHDPHEFDVLCKHYRCTDLDDMNYQQFCRDVDY